MSVRRRSFMSRDNTSHAWPKGKISCSICRPYQIEIDYGQNFNWLNTMKQRKITMCLLFHSSQIYYACPMDLLVTWGSNLAESSHHHSLANFSQSGFASNSSLLDKWASFFPKRTGFWCHLTFNNVVKMISNLTLPIVGESVIGWGIVSSIIYHLLIRM